MPYAETDLISKHVLKLDTWNPVKLKRQQNYTYSFIIVENDPIFIQCVVKVCEPLGSSFHLKGKLESITNSEFI